jgi:hypothetical protein
MCRPDGRLCYRDPEGHLFENVVAVRAFPITSPKTGLSLMSSDGHELLWIESLDDLPDHERELVQNALEQRDFMPEIRRLMAVSGFVTPCAWTVDTDRGETRFILKGEEDIRRLNAQTLLISDSQGIHYLLRDLASLDRQSRKFLDRFL